jgi:hypothetical protein
MKLIEMSLPASFLAATLRLLVNEVSPQCLFANPPGAALTITERVS